MPAGQTPGNEMGLSRYATIITLSVFLAASLLIACVMPRLHRGRREVVRQSGFIVLHFADYTANVLTMVVIYTSGNGIWLILLIPVHVAKVAFCIASAVEKTDWKYWPGNMLCNFMFVVIVLGLFQGIQVKLTYDDFVRSIEKPRGAEDDDVEASPQTLTMGRAGLPMVPPRFHCQPLEGLLESTAFAFVSLYLLLENRSASFSGAPLAQWHTMTFYANAAIACVSSGMALMEIDHKTSVAVQQALGDSNRSPLTRVLHLCFRTAEFMLRILTMVLFTLLAEVLGSNFAWPIVAVALDYTFCVVLVYFLGGGGGSKYSRRCALLLGLPLLVVNVVQFLDAPGLSLRARRISTVLVPLRLVELFGIVLAVVYIPATVKTNSPDSKEVTLLDFVLLHNQWNLFWLMSAVIYFVLFIGYAVPVKPAADLHSAVADNDVETLTRLLQQGELVLDINRYGPDGRTPLMLAARKGHVECMSLLIAEGAEMQLKACNRMKNTALHMAVMSKRLAPVQCLLEKSRTQESSRLINATNAQGNTALHMAAHHQNVELLMALLQQEGVDVKLKNAKNESALDMVAADKFGFDRNSSENAATELLRLAEQGDGSVPLLPSGAGMVTEMSSYGLSSDMNKAARHLLSSPRVGGLGPVPEVSEVNHCDSVQTNGVPDHLKQYVPLIHIKSAVERKYLEKHTSLGMTPEGGLHPVTNVTNYGLASFVMSAGLGFLGFLKPQEEAPQETKSPADAQVSFDDFEEIRPLGEGAFGKVVLVQGRHTGEQFAMKTMDKAKFKAQKITHKVISEQYILKTTRHPFIVGLHYAFQGSKFWALVMDLCPNGDLMKMLVDYGTPGLPLGETARYCGEVLLAIEHLHKIRVIFRDLKLDNVVIDTYWRARVTDFGLAKKLRHDSAAKTMCGSYGYAAPEIMAGKGKQYTFAVDLYSMGIMFYMMLSGGAPSHRSPKLRNPPMKHAEFKIKVRDAEKNPDVVWARDENHAIDLINKLTLSDANKRATSVSAMEHRFFTHHLGRPVRDLLEDTGTYWPPGGGPQPGLVAGTAAAVPYTRGAASPGCTSGQESV